MTISRRHTHENADAAGFQNSRKVYFEAHEDSILYKTGVENGDAAGLSADALQTVCRKAGRKGAGNFADAHHEDLPFP